MYRLHCFCQSGNSFKVAMMLNAVGVPWTPVFVDFMNGVTREPNWRQAINEMGEVPVFEDGALRLTQSGLILHYLAEKHQQFAGHGQDEKREVWRWILFDNHKFSSYFVSYRFLKSFVARPPDPAVMAWLKGRIDAAFAIADRHLATRSFVVGEHPTIADMSMAGYLFYPPEESGYELQSSHPNIARWLERVRAIPGWAHPYDILPGTRIQPFH
ncbi:glutathione S-transferase [Hyphomicrobium sp. CS1BSMeth3]|uniref:glutathione S-transferase family protein n=1 Tax=Hyphomicrobium sp. CS1BSMeth3 TaxID=1892844 RepID=UPI000931F19D|nr:glutathione S-transferase [Hyphomicrobium sp. CS1BSMeth3]